MAYRAVFGFHADDCTNTDKDNGGSDLAFIPTEAFSGVKDDVGERAQAIKVFEKSKAKTKEGKEDSITVDGVEIPLRSVELGPEALVSFLVLTINKGRKDEDDDFRNNEDAKAYQEMPYFAKKEKTYPKCKVKKSDWKKGSACLILTRVLWGAAGNGPIEYEESYTKLSD